jgi:chromosome partitioning protein
MKDLSKPHVIVIGNEKGGAGKTTTTVHLIVYLLNLGFKVSSIDADVRQQSLTRYLENRQITANKGDGTILLPKHFVAHESTLENISDRCSEEAQKFAEVYNLAAENADFIVIDTPGTNSNLSLIAHSHADTIITPMNDSFLDLDILARVDPEKMDVAKLSHYSQVIWQQKMQKAKNSGRELNWVILRNRLGTTDAINKRNVGIVLEKLSKRIGFRVAQGFSERVIFRELFLHGLTLLDLHINKLNINVTLSHLAAKHELREFLQSLAIKEISMRLEQEPQKISTEA